MRCPNCGNELMEGTANCNNCGFKLQQGIDNQNTITNPATNILNPTTIPIIPNQNNESINQPQSEINNNLNSINQVNNTQQINIQNNTMPQQVNNEITPPPTPNQLVKKNNTFIIVVVVLALIIVALLFLVLNKNGLFGNKQNEITDNSGINNNNQNINNSYDNTITIDGYKVVLPTGLFYRHIEEEDFYQISDKTTFIYDYMIAFDDVEYYIKDPSDITNMLKSYNVVIKNTETKNIKGTKILLFTLESQSADIDTMYYYIAGISDYVVSFGTIYGYTGMNLNNTLNYIATMNSSVKVYNSLAGNDNDDKISKDKIIVNTPNINDFN